MTPIDWQATVTCGALGWNPLELELHGRPEGHGIDVLRGTAGGEDVALTGRIALTWTGYRVDLRLPDCRLRGQWTPVWQAPKTIQVAVRRDGAADERAVVTFDANPLKFLTNLKRTVDG